MRDDIAEKVDAVAKLLCERQEILFAYLYGSAVRSDSPNDLDIAVYVERIVFERLRSSANLSLGYEIPLEQACEETVGFAVDVRVVNAAPLPYRYRVVTDGKLLFDRCPSEREQFELLSRVEYFDFRPRREEYLREALR
ncbi:MAG: hypothetical protein GF344_07950 [Chitinivibrionales bacterium]|nr:hypothetical protein [Chitinivibrionales bacterium]MBD3356822.1 hypothetical protein [Chitinivibrionales bacterium]